MPGQRILGLCVQERKGRSYLSERYPARLLDLLAPVGFFGVLEKTKALDELYERGINGIWVEWV